MGKITPASFFHLYQDLSIIKTIYGITSKDSKICDYLNIGINLNDEIDKYINELNSFLDISLCKDIDTLIFEENFIKKGVSKNLDDIILKGENSLKQIEAIKDSFSNIIGQFEKI